MSLITRQAKGSKLTIQEMDGNLIYLQGIYNDAGNSSENTSIDWSNGTLQELNIDDDPTLTFSNGVVGQTSKLLLKQQLSGLRTITWPNDVIWNGGSAPTLQTLSGLTAGDIDASFVYGTGFDGGSYSVNLQSDGKILVGGAFTDYNGTAANRIIRLNSNGSVDGTFVYGTGFNNSVYSITTQSDGKILIGGDFTTYNGTAANKIIRLNANGSVDNTFVYGTGFDDSVYSITTQSDGKILVGGGFTTYNGTAANRIIRLNTNGSVDNTFVYGTGFDGNVNSNSIATQSDGKILVGGGFTDYNGTSANGIIRLNSNGSVDGTFVYGTGFDNEVYSISIQSDGKILVGGSFASYNGTSADYIIRLNSNGSVDGTFVYGTGFDDVPYLIALQPDGKILAVGFFTDYDGTAANRIIRLIGISPLLLAYNTVEFDYNGTYYIGSY